MCFYYFPEKKKTQPYILTPQTYQEYWFFWTPAPSPWLTKHFTTIWYLFVRLQYMYMYVFIDMDKYCFFYVCQFEYYL